MNIGAFAVVFIMEGEGQEGNSINRFKGLAKKNPLTGSGYEPVYGISGWVPTHRRFLR